MADDGGTPSIETIDDLLAFMTEEATDRFEYWTFQPTIWDDGTYRFVFEYVEEVWEFAAGDTLDQRREQLPDDLDVKPYSRDIFHRLEYRWDDDAITYTQKECVVGSNDRKYTVEETETQVATVNPPDRIDRFAIRDLSG